MAKRMIAADGTQRFPLLDDSNNSQITVDLAHFKLHHGDSFVVTDIVESLTTTKKWMLTTADSLSLPHMIFDDNTTGESSIIITEGGDRIGTTSIIPVNRNRSSANTTGVVVHRDVSGGTTDGDVVIYSNRKGSTGNPSRGQTPGAPRGIQEFVLKPDTKYLIAVTTYADVFTTLDLNWYDNVKRTG
jgi:hypothetical protein